MRAIGFWRHARLPSGRRPWVACRAALRPMHSPPQYTPQFTWRPAYAPSTCTAASVPRHHLLEGYSFARSRRRCRTPTIASCRETATKFPWWSKSSPSSSRNPPTTVVVLKRQRIGPGLGCLLNCTVQLRVGTQPVWSTASTGGSPASSRTGAAARVAGSLPSRLIHAPYSE